MAPPGAAAHPHARVLAVDLRGHGQSTCELDSPDQLVADFERLVIDLDLRCPVILGHQYGGGIAAAVTAAYPLLWGALCVVDSPVISPQANYLGVWSSSRPPR
ncbi:alpha/beta fold hydrolase [Agilicoccus flavus]|uniref:alpha/beta fold hydrolase n=1 Tax=Agilicoccus flavus TaxID=2775968 RepID=UPI001CF6A824|nr:alpha/beta hydrolase [Agilicoccus flavus]